MTFLRRRTARFAIAALAVAGIGVGTTAAIAAVTKVDGSFAVTDLLLPAVPAGGSVSQSVAGLWYGDQPSSFTKVGGASWLSVDNDGVVTGTAPASAPSTPATITVTVGGDGTGRTLTLDVPVLPAGQAPRIEAASWNLDDAGSGTSDAVEKELQAIAGNDIDVVGLQETDGTAAKQIADRLGWYSYQSSGDLGIVSAYPISSVTEPTASTPAAGVTLDVDGHAVRVWTAHLDEADYAPYAACLAASTPTPADLVAAEKTTTRYAEAQAVAAEIKSDIAAASTTPVLFLGDLASPAASDWTAATAAAHCNVGAVDWPVPDAFTSAGLTDSYREAKPDPVANPGFTWSPLTKEHAGGSSPEPQDRIDYVDYAGPLKVLGAESLSTGWVDSQSGDVVSDWTSDHAAAVTLFSFTGGAGGSSPAPGTPPSATKPTSPKPTSPAKPKPSVKTLRSVKPRITGTAKVGKSLRAVAGAWSPTPVLGYQWYVAGKAIKGATRSTFVVRAPYRGKNVTVKVTGRKSGYKTVSATSAARKVAR